MDPLSILSLVEACAGLTVTAGKLAIGLKSLADNYRSAALTFRSLSTQCKLFATAVRAIQAWMEEAPDTSNIDDRIWEQLADSLECANDAIYALENDLVSTSKGTVNTFWEKVNVVWNVDGLKEMESCIHKQITGLGVILQIMNLPTRQCQTDGLVQKSSIFQESRSSAMSVRDPETSTIRGGCDATSTIRAPSTIMTALSQMPNFDFEEMLLTSQVYLRNRNKTLALNGPSSKSGKMQDASVSVTHWDLPIKFPKYAYIDLHGGANLAKTGSKEDLIAYVDSHVLPKHEELQAKYSKVKRYYFESQDHIKTLQEDIEKLKAEDPNHRSQVALSAPSMEEIRHKQALLSAKRELEKFQDQFASYKRGTQQAPADHSGDTATADFWKTEQNEVERTVKELQEENEKLQKQMGWYKIQLSYWTESSSGSGGSISIPGFLTQRTIDELNYKSGWKSR